MAELARTNPELAAWLQHELSKRDFSSNDKQEVADFFGVAMETIDLWQRKGMPYISGGRGVRGHYDLRECARWVYQQRGPVSEDVKDVDHRYREEKLKIAELHRKKLQGEFLDRAAWREAMARLVSMIRTATESMHRKYGNQFAEDMAELLDKLGEELKQYETETVAE